MIMKTMNTIYTNFAKRFAVVLTLLTFGLTSVWAATETATLDFTKANNCTSIDADKQIWTENGITLTNDKHDSPTNVTNYTPADDDPIRCYKNSKITITHTSNKIAKIVFKCSESKYNISIGSSEKYEVNANGNTTTTVTFKELVASYEQVLSSGQVRLNSIEVTYESAPSTFTVTCKVNEETPWGTLSSTDPISDLASGTSISAEGNVLTIGETEITATPNEADAQYTYAFKEWTWEPAGATITSDVVATATFTRNDRPLINYRTLCTYDIVLKNNYGDDDSKDGLATITSTHTAFSTLTAPSAREGYSIEGYYAESECTTKVVNSDKTLILDVTNYTDADGKWIGGETTLYTKWTGRTYTVTLDDNGGSGGSGTITATYGSPMPAITLPTRTGYTFNGYWTGTTIQSTQYYDANGNSLKNWDKAGNTTTLYALWTANTNTPYVVKHYKEQLDGTYPAEADDTDNLTGTTAASVTPAVNSYEGFTAPSTQTVSIAADGSTVVTYQYTRNSYNLSWNVNEGDALTGEYTSGNVKYEAAITQPNTPTRTGYTFIGWSPAEIPATMPANNLEFIAQWAAIYTVTWMVNGSQAEGDPTTSVVNGQTITTLPTTPDVDCNGKVFVGWTTAEIVGETTTIPDPLYTELGDFPVVTSNMTFYAVFANGSGDERWVETEIGQIQSGDEVVIAMSKGQYTWTISNAKNTSSTAPEANDITANIQGKYLTTIDNEAKWVIERNNANLTFYSYSDKANYLYCTNADNGVRVGGTGDAKVFVVDGNYLKNTQTTLPRYLGVSLNTNPHSWRCYTETTGVIQDQTLKFYKKTTVYTSYTNYSTSCVAGEFDITNTDPIYVTSAVGQKIKATDKLVLTTTDMAVGTEISLSAPNITFYKEGVEITQLTTESLEETFELEIAYQPTISKTTEQPTITLEILGYQFTFNNKISCRSLPENFVIATKVGATWYALPANMNGATNPEGVVIDVDETTMTATAPNTTVYTLFPVKTTSTQYDRFADFGDRVRFSAVNNESKGLWATSNGNTINNGAQIASESDGGTTDNTNPSYEWKITTTIVNGNWQYTLQTDQPSNQKYLRYWTAASGGAKWGTYASGNDKLYFLPVTETKPFDYKVVEWYPTKMLIQTEAAITNPIVKIGGILVDHVTCTNKGGKLYEISGLPLVNNPTKVLTLSYTADEVTYTNSKVVPIILSRETKSISGEPFVALTKEVYNYANLVVRDGATLTMDGTQEANTLWDVTIYPTSKISVPETKKLTVHSLTFFGGIDEIYNGSTYTLNKYGVPELSLKGNLKKSISTIDYLMRVNLDQMYSLSVPYDVQLADIKYWDGSDIALGSALYVSAYDGQARANRESKTWVYETDFATKFGSATLKAGVGYTISAELQAGVGSKYSILRMPMNSNIANDATEAAKTVAVTAWGKDANVTDNHKGWNLVGNPYMTTIQGADDADLVLGYLKETGTGPWEWVEKTYRYVTIPSDDGTYYWQPKFTDAVLPPFKNFFVQVGTTGELVFDLGTRQSMPARSTQAAIEKEVEFEILMSNGARQDNSGLLISEEYSPAYEINADLEKMIGSMSVYTIYGGYKLAYNALSPINASEWIPMGYIAPAAGEYTFRLDDVENIAEQVEHVYVIDYDANNIVDLMTDEYKFTTNKEQNDNRFAINVVLVQDKDDTTTGLDMIQGNNAVPIKFIYQDKIYIQSGGIIYDATGKQVTNINK